jgi:phenylalanyl-tRNA synthetase beta chain
MNPLSSEQGFLRTTLIPGLVESLAHNLNQKQGYVGLFEAANVFSGKAKEPQEELKLGIVLSGMRKALLSDATVSDEAGVLHLKGIIEALFLNSGAGEVDFIGRGEAGVAVLSANEEVGFIRPLGRALLEKAEIKNREVFAAELALDRLIKLSGKEKKYLPLSRYPGITRDVSFILKKESPVKEIIRALEKTGRPLLLGVRIADYYQGKQIPQGYRGLTISCSYGSSERTLTEEEVQPVHELICAELTDAFGAKIR